MARLVVLNKDDDTLSIIDADTGETLETVATEFNPHEVAVGPDGEKVYVTCSLGGALLVYDADSWERRATIEHDTFDFPHGLAVRESAGELWLASTYASEIAIVDLATDEITETFPTYQDKSHMVSLTPDESTAFVANIGSDSVTEIDCEQRRVVADPPVGEGPEGIAAMAEYVLVANQDDGRLSVLDYDSRDEVNQALLGETPIRVVPQPGGRYVFVPNRESNDVSVVDTEHVRNGERRPWEVKRVPVGRWPGGTVFDPAGERAYVANNKTNDVSVIDADALEETDRYDAGTHPDGIAYLA